MKNNRLRKRFYKISPTSKKDFEKLDYGKPYVTKGGKLSIKQTPKDKIINFLNITIKGVILAIFMVLKFISNHLHNFFYTKSNFQNNGICGPGYSSWHEEHFSWGKLSLVIVVSFILIYIIYLR